MKRIFTILTLLALAAFSGGCAVIPVALTGASMAAPKAISLAITGVKLVHKTTLLAADERHTSDIASDTVLDMQASMTVMTATGIDADVHTYNGQIYVVGEYDTTEHRDQMLADLRAMNGVRDVKGVLRPETAPDDLRPGIRDSFAENAVAANLISELGLDSANVDVEVIQGEAVLVGVVETHDEERALEAMVNGLKKNKGMADMTVTSLVTVQRDFDAGVMTADIEYSLGRAYGPPVPEALLMQDAAPVLAQATPAVRSTTAGPAAVHENQTVGRAPNSDTLRTLAANYKKHFSKWTRARRSIKHEVLTLCSAEQDANTRNQLRTMARKLTTDRQYSIADRLELTMQRSHDLRTKQVANTLLKRVAPERAVNMSALALN